MSAPSSSESVQGPVAFSINPKLSSNSACAMIAELPPFLLLYQVVLKPA
jgi:hypothetical protein